MSEETTTIMTDGGGETSTDVAVTPEATGALPTHLVGMDGKLAPGWHEHVGMEVDKSLHNVTDLQTVLKSWKDAQVHIGQQGAEMGSLRKQLDAAGQVTKPANASEYSMTIKPADVPDDAWDQESADKWANIFHENGISDAAANELTAKFAEQVAQNSQSENEKILQQKQQNEAELKQEWGRAYEANLEKAITTARDLKIDISDPDIGNHIGLVRVMNKITDSLSESVMHSLGVGNSVGINARDSGLLAQAQDIQMNPNNPDYAAYHNPSDGRYLDIHSKVDHMIYEGKKRLG